MDLVLPPPSIIALKLNLVLVICVWISAYAAIKANNRQTARSSRPFRLTIIVLGFSSTCCIVTAHLFTSLIFAHLSIWITLYLVARWAHRGKGSVILTTGTFFVILDSAAIFSLAIWPSQQLATTTIVLLAAFARLMVPFVSWWFRLLDRVSPVFIAIVFIGLIAPCGTALLLNAKQLPVTAGLESVTATGFLLLIGSSLFMGALNLKWHRKDFTFFSISIFALYSPAFLFIKSGYQLVSLNVALILATIFNLFIYSRFPRNKQYTTLCLLLCFALVLGAPPLGPGTSLWLAVKELIRDAPSILSPRIFFSSLAAWACAFFMFFRVSVEMSLYLPTVEQRDGAKKAISWNHFISLYLTTAAALYLFTWWIYDA